MIMKIEPIYKAVKKIKKSKKSKVILLSAKGKKFNQKMAQRFSKLDNLIIISGRYEGVDERVAKYVADEEISIGEYILTGGELPAMVIVDAVSRLVPGVIKKESLKEESFSVEEVIEYPQYTRPEEFLPTGKHSKNWSAPKVLLSGNHQKIKEWKKRNSKSFK